MYQANEMPPWASGPAEILQHGIELLGRDSDSNCRLAMISIDNAVELILKTYLGLPKRITGLSISRSEYQEFSESFPRLLDAIEKYGTSRISSVDLDEIEWYHRLRNQLYHQGNGLTVERVKVEVYGQLAVALLDGLFGVKVPIAADNRDNLLAEFIVAWSDFEKIANDLSSRYWLDDDSNMRTVIGFARQLANDGYLTESEFNELQSLWSLRNTVVNGTVDFRYALNASKVGQIRDITTEVRRRIIL